MTKPPPRSRRQRRLDTLARLAHDVDLWLATGGEVPYLVPLSFVWDGGTLLVATPARSVTSRNINAEPTVRVALGTTRDVVMVDGTADGLTPDELPAGVADAFAARTGFEPRALSTPYRYFRIRPRRIQAWREENELRGRELMADGAWLDD